LESGKRRPRKCLWCPYTDGCPKKCERNGDDPRSYTLIRQIEVDEMLEKQSRKLTRRWAGAVVLLLVAQGLSILVILLLSFLARS
jgi:hypothetical protein